MIRFALRLVSARVFAAYAGRITALAESRTRHRAWLTDCDLNFHLNEGRYLTVAGLGRLALWFRMGLGPAFLRRGLRPAAVSAVAYYYREIPLFARFDVVSRLIAWDAKYMFFEHRFVRNDADVARVVVRSVFRDRSGTVVPAELLATLGCHEPAPPLPPELEHWARMREAARTTSSGDPCPR